MTRARFILPACLLALVVAVVAFSLGGAPARACPKLTGEAAAEHAREAATGDEGETGAGRCPVPDLAEPKALAATGAQHAAEIAAPSGRVPAGSYARALAERAEIARTQKPKRENTHRWARLGNGPLHSADPGYTEVNGLGLRNVTGRITDFAYDPAHNHLYASVSYGGVWESDDQAGHWRSISGNLPTQITGSVGYTPAGGGAVIAATGDAALGRYSREGAGVFRTTDGGRHWTRSRGVPSSAFSFNVAVDDSHPSIVYVATGAGLYRSTDAGRTFSDVRLPTGPCAGKGNRGKCLLANQVTDVVVREPNGSSGGKGGQVLAVVGYKDSDQKNPDGTVQSPANGLYSSATGAPGTFTRLTATGFPDRSRQGRVELGGAVGAQQNHDYVYAVVQDALYDQTNNNPAIEADDPTGGQLKIPTTVNGIYVSPDFGQTWRLMADGATDLQAPTTGSALAGVAQATSNYGPGIQSWYNEWIQPDPTRAVAGIPTRVLFGLEEIWQNETTNVPQAGKSSFRVVGRYYGGDTCLFLSAPACPTNREDALANVTTTHPDQHAAIWIPQKDGGVRLVVSNDGGAYTQLAGPGKEIVARGWGDGAQSGLNTLLAYHATRARNGTVYLGLQDNGTAKISDVRDPKTHKITQRGRVIGIKGGDGFFVGVDPDNSKIAYGEYVDGAIAGTKDGGKNWADMAPPITDGQFSTPFAVDPLDAQHVVIAGRQVVETGSGPGTSADDWAKDFDLGTAQHRGDADAQSSPEDPANAMTAIADRGPNVYVGFCGTCDVLGSPAPFRSGIATNVGGSKRPKRYSSQGWHFAPARGLPNRYITSIAIDPKNPKNVYVTLGTYLKRWVHPGAYDHPRGIGGGHLYVSHDAGGHFRDISANLPNAPLNWVALRPVGKRLQTIVASDVGVMVSDPNVSCRRPAASSCRAFSVLGRGLPATVISTIEVAPWDPNLLTVATWGRGVWSYRFGPPAKAPHTHPEPPPPPLQNVKLASYDFETGAQGFTTTSNDSVSGWRLTPPGNNSSQAFAVQPYTDAISASLTSPTVKLPVRSSVKVSWADMRDTEECCDGLSLDWSSDGHVWHPATTLKGQNKDFPAFSPESATFVAPAGTVEIRFRMTSDQLVSSPAYTGVRVDDVTITR